MSIESLYCQTGTHIPNWYTFISRTTHKEISERLEVKTINSISMLAILLTNFQRMQIVKLNCSITTRWKDKVTCVVELDFPNWLRMHVGESVRNWGIHEVPKFDTTISTRSDKMRPGWVKVDSGYPVPMTFSGHNVFFSFHIPYLPGAVIRSSRHNLLSHVKSHTSDSLVMCTDSLLSRHSAR